MQRENDTVTKYMIPGNFIEEGTVFQGRVKIRNLAEALIMCAVLFLPAYLIIKAAGISSLQAKVSITAAFCLPGAIAGITGFNGDRIFLAVKCIAAWLKNRETMLYNPRPVLLRNDPAETMNSDISRAGRLLAEIEEKRKARMNEKAGARMYEGEDFFFTPEEGMDKYVKSGGEAPAGTENVSLCVGDESAQEEELY